jgi:hypothetical protein
MDVETIEQKFYGVITRLMSGAKTIICGAEN